MLEEGTVPSTLPSLSVMIILVEEATGTELLLGVNILFMTGVDGAGAFVIFFSNGPGFDSGIMGD